MSVTNDHRTLSAAVQTAIDDPGYYVSFDSINYSLEHQVEATLIAVAAWFAECKECGEEHTADEQGGLKGHAYYPRSWLISRRLREEVADDA